MFTRLGSVAAVVGFATAAQDAPLDHFEKKIRPVLASRCYACHSASVAAPQGGLRLDSARAILQGGNSGPAIQPGDATHSLLIRAIRHTDNNLKMPPDKPLAPEVVADFDRWIREGAPLPEDRVKETAKQPVLWSLTTPKAPAAPAVRNRGAIRNEIDRFVLSRLDASNLTFSPEAGKRTLIRRATYDLTGLPPAAHEIKQFVRDDSPRSYELLIIVYLPLPAMVNSGRGTGWMWRATPTHSTIPLTRGSVTPGRIPIATG